MMLSIRLLTKRFDGLLAIDNVSFDVDKAQIYGVLGPNGAGKTTFFNMVSGVYPITSGQIFLDGYSLVGLRSHQIARKGVGRTFQIVRPFSDLSVRQNVFAGMAIRHQDTLRGLLQRYGSRANVALADEILEHTSLRHVADEPARNLPLGMLRRLEIARALALQPRLLLLDESFSGLSHAEARELVALVSRLRSEGMTILLIEHNMRIAMSLCDRICVLERGKTIAEGPAEVVRADPRVIAAYLGGAEDA